MSSDTDHAGAGWSPLKRATELDALDAIILPFDRRDRLAELLTDDDIATLKHLASCPASHSVRIRENPGGKFT